jgi:topoisomerase-4 subunit A
MIFKFEPETIFTVLYIEAETKLMYIKRFTVEEDTPLNKRISFIGESEDAKLIAVNMDMLPRLLLKFNDGVSGKHFEDEEVNVDEYIGVKSYKAKGKRLSVHDVNYYEFLEPFEPPVVEEETPADIIENAEPDSQDNFENSERSEVVETPETIEVSEAEQIDSEEHKKESDNNKDGQLTLF